VLGSEVAAITVDRERCIGSGMCMVYAPATFAHDDEAKAMVVDQSGDGPDALAAALEACPTRALRMEAE
jgi:ferredoxin